MYVALTGLHWFAVGLAVPVLILTLQARGLSLPTIGFLYAANGILTAGLELPTGGLADSHGRRPVLIASALLNAAALMALGLGANLVVLAVGLVLLASGRALSSGPLEAWYVDAELAREPKADLTPGLGAGGRALGLGLAAGTLIGGLLPTLFPALEADGAALLLRTSVPFVVGAIILVIEAVAVRALIASSPSGVRPGGTVVGSMAEGWQVGRRSPATRRILWRYAAAGVAGTAFEILVPIRLGELTGSATAAAAVYGPLTAVGLGGGALAAGYSHRVRELAGTPARGALILTLAAGLGGLAAGVPAVAAVIAGSLSIYVLTGPCPPLLNTVLHAEVGAEARTVMVSVTSLVAFAGSAVGGFVMPSIAVVLGTGAGLAVGAGVLAAGALPLVGVRVSDTAGIVDDAS